MKDNGNYMIGVQEAKHLIGQNVVRLQPVTVPIEQAGGLTLASEIRAPMDMPPFPQSGMDGYAFAFDTLGQKLEVAGEQPAGAAAADPLPGGSAIRIFTGAAVPDGADTVVIQEKSAIENGCLVIMDENLQKGDNVRPAGSEIPHGSAAIPAGTMLRPATIGFLAGMGITQVPVFPAPRVSLVVTGNELQHPGQPLAYGQVYESNSYSLQTALRIAGVGDVTVYTAEDQPETLRSVLKKAFEQSDLVLITGGVSVGDYDFTRRVFEESGGTVIFHKIKQKPGKPLLFGIRGGKPLFGLPGNPASVLTCFYEYVVVALEHMMQQSSMVQKVMAPIDKDLRKAPGLTHFLKADFDGTTARLLHGQESYKLSSFALANALVILPESATGARKDEMVEIHLLPG